MSIVQNLPCPACQEMGHDKTGNHLMVFEDGNQLCNRSHFHKDGLPFFVDADGENPILGMEIRGDIKYTVDQWEALLEEGKLSNPSIRALALSGMRQEDRWTVANEEERALMLKERDHDQQYFDNLSFRNLKSRHIRGEIAKHYGIKTGVDSTGKKVTRHYYPCYDRETGEWRGAKCRTLPKDFKSGHLGWTHGDLLMFGQKAFDVVAASGQRQQILTLCGGELDAAAAFQMIVDYNKKKGGKYANQLPHVWSPNKGENSLDEIIANSDAISRFKEIRVAADDDEVGLKLCADIAKLFRGKVRRIEMPQGCKDPNECLMDGREEEFINNWFNPVDPFGKGNVREVSHYADKAKVMVKEGLSWPWPEMDPVTFGMQLNSLVVWGAGTGVGKTQTTKEIVYHLTEVHKEQVMVIYLEEPAVKTTRSFAGMACNKDFTAPPVTNKSDPNYHPQRDYTQEDLNKAVDDMVEKNMILIGDLEGRKDIGSVLEVLDEAMVRGIKYFVVDNLTAFDHTGKDGKAGTKTEAIDETMKRLGTFKDENAVAIHLLSHLNRSAGSEATPHTEGGEVRDTHFRGAGSITMWANLVFGIERNTKADTLEEKCRVRYRCVKNRDIGYQNGAIVHVKMDLETGHLVPDTGVNNLKEDFDDGSDEENPF